MNKVCLVILYNSSDISRIDDIKKRYEGKFDKIYHLAPLYKGDDNDVIPVYENPIQITGYIAQSYNKIYSQEYSHYIFMHDDCILNYDINSNNLCDYFGIDNDTCFISDDIKALDENTIAKEPWALPSLYNHVYSRNGAQIAEFTYKKFEARQKYLQFGIATKKIRVHYLQYLFNHLINGRFQKDEFNYQLSYGDMNPKTLTDAYLVPEDVNSLNTVYPFVYSKAKFFIIPNKILKGFAYYCGIYAAVRVHSNMGFATSLCFSADKIAMLKDLPEDKKIIAFDKSLDDDSKQDLIDNVTKEGTLVVYPLNDK